MGLGLIGVRALHEDSGMKLLGFLWLQRSYMPPSISLIPQKVSRFK